MNLIDKTKESIAHCSFRKRILNIRAGRRHQLWSSFVDYYGSSNPAFTSVKNYVPDARTIRLQPFEKNMLNDWKAIMVANIGFEPMNNGDLIIY
jgi:ribosome recycling factor